MFVSIVKLNFLMYAQVEHILYSRIHRPGFKVFMCCYELFFFDTRATGADSSGTRVDCGSDLASSVILAPPVGWPLRLAEAFQSTSQ